MKSSMNVQRIVALSHVYHSTEDLKLATQLRIKPSHHYFKEVYWLQRHRHRHLDGKEQLKERRGA